MVSAFKTNATLVEAERAPTIASIERIIADAGGIERVALSDLTLGGWRPHQIAAEWLEAFGMTGIPGGGAGSVGIPRAGVEFAAIAEAGIDAEAQGERVAAEAFALARRLLCFAQPSLFLLLVPFPGNPWREENLTFLQFVAREIGKTPHKLRLLVPLASVDARGDAAITPPGFQFRWVQRTPDYPLPSPIREEAIAALPGIVPEQISTALRGDAPGLLLPSGKFLPSPELRTSRKFPSTTFDMLRPALCGSYWLSAYAHWAGSSFHVDAAVLADVAHEAFAQGSVELAMDYLIRATICTRGIQRAGAQCQLQGYRIASHRFTEAAKADRQSPNLPGPVAAFLSMARGWGAVMSGQAEKGLGDLQVAAQHLAQQPDERFCAFLKNITALGLARIGRVDEALQLELAIEKHNIGLRRSWPLHYVNQINIARLHRRKGDLAAARVHFERAFETHFGGRSAIDRIYVNAVRARLAEACGEPAGLHWFRAALHFAAMDVPEAFGQRHAGMIIGNGVHETSREGLAEAVAAKLSEKVGPWGTAEPTEPPPLFADAPPTQVQLAEAHLVGMPGWSVIVLPGPMPSGFDGPFMRRLRCCLRVAIRKIAGFGPDWRPACFLVDSRVGREIALDLNEAVETAVRLGIDRVCFSKTEVSLDAKRRMELALSSRLGLNNMVADVKQRLDLAYIRFKRYRANIAIADPFGLVAAAQRGDRIGDVVGEAALGTRMNELLAEIVLFEKAGVLWRILPRRSFPSSDDAGLER